VVTICTACRNIHTLHSVPTCSVYVVHMTVAIKSDRFRKQHYAAGFVMETRCVYCELGTVSLNTGHTNLTFEIVEARVRSQANASAISGGQSGTVTGFSPSISVFPCRYHSTNAPYSSSSTRCCYQKDKRAKAEILLQSSARSEIGERWM
jgi:hypothetical protein